MKQHASGRDPLQRGQGWLSGLSRIRKSRYLVIGKWLVLLGLLFLVMTMVSLKDVVAGLSRASYLTLVCFLGLMLVSRYLYSLRWSLICRNGLGLGPISSLFLLRVNLLGEFVGIALPSSLGGEAARLLKLSARTGNTPLSGASIVVDRLVGLVNLGLIVLVLLPRLWVFVAWPLPFSPGTLLVGVACALAALGVSIFWLQRRYQCIQLPDAVKHLSFSGWSLISVMLLSLAGHLVFAIGHYLLFVEIQPFPFLIIISLVLTAQLARTIPISLLGIGLSEGSMVALASLVGVDPDAALAVVIISLGSRYLFAISGLLIELGYDGKAVLSTMASHASAGLETSP